MGLEQIQALYAKLEASELPAYGPDWYSKLSKKVEDIAKYVRSVEMAKKSSDVWRRDWSRPGCASELKPQPQAAKPRSPRVSLAAGTQHGSTRRVSIC